jgi:hypothetical protein
MMKMDPRSAYVRWREANEAARAKENELNVAWNEFFDRRAKPPSEELVRAVQTLRRAADQLLTEVIAAGGPVSPRKS